MQSDEISDSLTRRLAGFHISHIDKNKYKLFRFTFSMNLIDIHCHLNHASFKDDLDQVVERARKAGVKAVICSGVNHPTNQEALQLAEKYDLVKASLGLYPIDLLGLGPDEVGLTRQTEPIDHRSLSDSPRKIAR